MGKNKDLMDHLQMKRQTFSKHNQTMSEKRAAKLEEAGGIRAMESTGGKFTRGFKPRFEMTVRQMGTVDRNEVTDVAGNSFLTRFVQPVSNATADVGPVRIEQRGSAQTRAKQIRRLQPFADGLQRALQTNRTVAAMQAPTLLQSVRGGCRIQIGSVRSKTESKSARLKTL